MPSLQQAEKLRAMLQQGNKACDAISRHAFDTQLFGRIDLHRALYYHIKGLYELPAQLTIRCIAKVADSYKKKRNTRRHYKPLGAIAFDQRNLSLNKEAQCIRIRTLGCRETISYTLREQDLALLQYQQGECDLFFKNGKWYLSCCCTVPDEKMQDPENMLGVDLGIVQIASTSDGKQYSGTRIESVRQKHQRRRNALQQVATKSAKRRLKKNAGKEKRFRKDINHRISKEIVTDAKRTGCAIVLEDLKGVGDRLRVSKANRARFSGWSFFQLRQLITYKAQLSGVPVRLVDPKYTSQRCHVCAHVEKANRRSQSEFRCRRCGHEDNADLNAAKNIQLLGTHQRSYGRIVEFIRL